MPVRLYKEFFLVSRPRLDRGSGVWRAYASVLGPGSAVYHQFNDLEKTFLTEEEAEAFGFNVAGDWIDKDC